MDQHVHQLSTEHWHVCRGQQRLPAIHYVPAQLLKYGLHSYLVDKRQGPSYWKAQRDLIRSFRRSSLPT